MHSAAAGLHAVVLLRQPERGRIGVRAPRHRLQLGIRTQILALEIAQFVELKIRRLEARTAFKPDDLEPGLAEFRRHDATHGAHADDDHIRLFGCHGYHPLEWAWRPVIGARVKGLVLPISAWV